MILPVLLIIGRVEQNLGPIAEVENTVRILCTGCGRNLKSGIQCGLCGRWFHYHCGNVKVQTAERENWNCDKCRMEKARMLQEELQNAMRQIEELKVRNRELEAKLQMAGVRDTMPKKQKAEKCVVIGDLLVRNVRVDHAEMKVDCFPGIKTEQLRRVMERMDLASAEMLIIHVGTNDLRSTRNLDFIMGEVVPKIPSCHYMLLMWPSRRKLSSIGVGH